MKNLEKTLVYAGKWLNLNITKFPTKSGEVGIWEHVCRPTRTSASDGVSILATIIHENTLKLITVAVYRIPIDQWVLELPSGMIDPKDKDPVSSALRELKEETGYTAYKDHVKEEGIITYNDPWKSNECSQLIKVHVEAGLKENLNPVQDLDPEEKITVNLIPVNNMTNELIKVSKANNYAIDSRVYAFALGLNFLGNSRIEFK